MPRRTAVLEGRWFAKSAGEWVFAESYSRIVLPRARELFITAENAARSCSVFGDFSDERTALAYCRAYAWNHFASFKRAVNILGLSQFEFGSRLLVIDIGCGPATALLAFAEWLYESRKTGQSMTYIGVDRSEHMRSYAARFARDGTLFEAHEPLVLQSTNDLTAEILKTYASGASEVVILLSYVLHQKFMLEENVISAIVRNLAGSSLPIWLLAQDANKPQRDEANMDWWPENRLRAMLEGTEAFGYSFRVWSRKFEALKYTVNDLGEPVEQPRTGQMGAKAIAARSTVS